MEICSNQVMQDQDATAPHDRLSTIKAMFRFLLRMMESSGTTDGLRNLIDSTLPQSLKMIMEHPKLFGNSIFAIAINVSTTFIHNEPTSLPILQEAKLPQSFLHTIATYESPDSDVLLAAVNAFGAMCLNAQGLDMFNKEKPLPHFFDLMTCHDFLRNPIDIDRATGLGSTMDELIRHHPSLKPSVFQCVTALIKKVIVMGTDENGQGKPSDNSHLLQTRQQEDDAIIAEVAEEDKAADKVECLLVSFIDLVSRFLEGLFQNQSNIKDFVEGGCPEMLLNYFSLPLLPTNFSATIASDSLSYLFRMIAEVSPLPTVWAIATKVRETLGFITEKGDDYDQSALLEFVDVNAKDTEKLERGNKMLRQMIELHGYTGLLSSICCSSVLSHGKNGASLVTEFLQDSEERGNENIILLFGRLHRAMVWENLLLKEALPPAWYAFKASFNTANPSRRVTSSMNEHPLGIYSTSTNISPVEANTTDVDTAAAVSTTSSGNANATTSTSDVAATTKQADKAPSAKDPRMINIKHFKVLLTEVSQLLVPIFQGLIKVSVSRRSGSTLPKQQTMKLAEYMSDLLRDSMTWSPITKPTAPACKYDYLTSVYTMTSLLLRDERTQSSLQTPLAIAFETRGGVDLLLEHLKQMWDASIASNDDKALTTRIHSAMESLLNVLLHISSPKSLRDSAYTSTLIEKDKNADYPFDPAEWIVALELKLVPLKDYLISDQLHLFSKAVNQTLIKIFQQIMKGEGSFGSSGSGFSAAAATAAANALRGGVEDPFGNLRTPLMTSPFTLLRAPVVAAERNIQTLVDMGFERASAEQALVRCNNQVSRAVDYLFNHPTPMIGTTTTAASSTPLVASTANANPAVSTNPAAEGSSSDAPASTSNEQPSTEEETDHDNDSADEEQDHQENSDEDDEDADSDANMEETRDNFIESLANEYDLLRNNMPLGPTYLTPPSGSGSGSTSTSDDVKKLKTVRHELCADLPAALLALADQREDLVFDIRDLLVILGKFEDNDPDALPASMSSSPTKTTKTSVNIVTMLVDQIGEIRGDASKSVLLSSRLRLFALLLREPPMQAAMNQLTDRCSFLFDMLNFANVGEEETLPAWSATIFLVLEAFIAQADEPKKVKLTTPSNRHHMFESSSSDEDEDDEDEDDDDEDNEERRNRRRNRQNNTEQDDPMEDVASTSNTGTEITQEQRGQLLQCCVSLLRKSKLSRDDIYAILRMIVRLTKNHDSALHFVGIGGVPLLFSKPRSSLEGLQGQQAFIILILRHIVESNAVLKNTMKDIITNWFTNPRPRNMDISSFVRSNAPVALREPAVFVEVTTDICRLARYDEFEINRQIKLKKQDEDEEKKGEDEQAQVKQSSSSEVVVYYLLNEIMTVRSEITAAAKKDVPTEDDEKKEENIKFAYTGFLLQCLVELISSYPSCKYDIFNFCKKQNGHRTTTLDGKHRSFVSMLINDLLPYNHINPSAEESRKQQGLSTWTASTLVAMSYDATSSHDLTAQQKSELIQVRKYVLEAIVRSLKEAVASSDTASVKYSKYLALADLCHRILNARPNVGSLVPRSLGGGSTAHNNQIKEDVALSNAKIMLDKNFVAVLTSAISDIDVNYPHSRTILNSMLRPLEQLTKLAIKTEDDTADTDEEGEDKMDTTEEGLHVPSTPAAEGDEAPDLYRNSALGMFDAGSVIDEDEYNSGEYSDMFGSSADEEEE